MFLKVLILLWLLSALIFFYFFLFDASDGSG